MTFLVVDLEWTCGDSIPNEEQETIEIGAVILSDDGDTILAEFSTLIKPVRHQVSELCESVTNISNEMLLSAPKFPPAMRAFTSWTALFSRGEPGQGPAPRTCNGFCSWGKSDQRLLMQDVKFWDHENAAAYPFTEHTDLARMFTKKTGSKRGHRQAMKRLGIKPEGAHHRGLDDARNIAKMVPMLLFDEETDPRIFAVQEPDK
jgi:inhibitor of KinA sporulation pathway (predicted exonuclease)